MTEAFKEGQLMDRINEAKRIIEILKEVEGKPWPILPRFSPGYRIGSRLADEVADLAISVQERKGRIDG